MLDANVFLSYLIAVDADKTVVRVVRACFGPTIRLIVPHELLDEIETTAVDKAYFRERIPAKLLQAFRQELTLLAEFPPPVEHPSRFGRDADDDYLMAYALVNDVIYLVTGDQDLLVLGQIGNVRIVTPATFLQLLGPL